MRENTTGVSLIQGPVEQAIPRSQQPFAARCCSAGHASSALFADL